jgi:hypothetical protein
MHEAMLSPMFASLATPNPDMGMGGSTEPDAEIAFMHYYRHQPGSAETLPIL